MFERNSEQEEKFRYMLRKQMKMMAEDIACLKKATKEGDNAEEKWDIPWIRILFVCSNSFCIYKLTNMWMLYK